jgi:hypothetical protein
MFFQNQEQLTQEGIQENPDLQNLNLNQLDGEALRVSHRGLMVHISIINSRNSNGLDRLIQKRWYWVKRGLAIRRLKNIKFFKDYERLKEDNGRLKFQHAQLILDHELLEKLHALLKKENDRFKKEREEREEIYRKMDLDLKNTQLENKFASEKFKHKIDGVVKEREAEKARREELEKRLAEMEQRKRREHSELFDASLRQEWLDIQQKIANRRAKSRDAIARDDEEHTRRKSNLQKDFEGAQLGTDKTHSEGVERERNGIGVETCVRPQQSEAGAEDNNISQFDPDLSQPLLPHYQAPQVLTNEAVISDSCNAQTQNGLSNGKVVLLFWRRILINR